MTKTSVAILYGFAEGKNTARELVRTLENSNHRITNPAQADVIIAHSGGCFVASNYPKARKIILINPTIWPMRNLLQSIRARNDLQVSLWSFWYALIRPAYNYRMFTHRSLRYLPTKEQSFVIKNEQDTYFSPTIYKELKAQGYDTIEFSGEHDDIWNNPERYIQFLS